METKLKTINEEIREIIKRSEDNISTDDKISKIIDILDAKHIEVDYTILSENINNVYVINNISIDCPYDMEDIKVDYFRSFEDILEDLITDIIYKYGYHYSEVADEDNPIITEENGVLYIRKDGNTLAVERRIDSCRVNNKVTCYMKDRHFNKKDKEIIGNILVNDERLILDLYECPFDKESLQDFIYKSIKYGDIDIKEIPIDDDEMIRVSKVLTKYIIRCHKRLVKYIDLNIRPKMEFNFVNYLEPYVTIEICNINNTYHAEMTYNLYINNTQNYEELNTDDIVVSYDEC